MAMNQSMPLLVGLIISSWTVAAATSFGLIRSTDGGESWSEVSRQFRNNRVNVLNISGERNWAGSDHGLFFSVDNGVTWTLTGRAELFNTRVLCVLTGVGWVLAGTEADGIWRSIDNGRVWARASEMKYVRSLAWNQGMFWAGCNDGTVWVSENFGSNWRKVSDGLPENGQIFELRPDSKGRLYAGLYSKGVYKLHEGTWRRLGNEARPHAMFAADVLLSGNNPGGIYRSVDDGMTWRHVTQGVDPDAPSWTFLETSGVIFYGTTGASGLYASRDRGETWRAVTPDFLHNRSVVALAADGKKLLAATVDNPKRRVSARIFQGEIFAPTDTK
jgi:photosystem II stability/assembly factor-like uncharacterized protein